MGSFLEQTGLFDVKITHTDTIWLGIKYNPNRPGTLTKYIDEFPIDTSKYIISDKPPKNSNFSIDFNQYDLIVFNLGLMASFWPFSLLPVLTLAGYFLEPGLLIRLGT